MAFIPKSWQNDAAGATPLSAAAITDAEVRVTDYADAVAAGGVEVDWAQITGASNVVNGFTFVNVAGLAVAVPQDTRPVVVEVEGVIQCDAIRPAWLAIHDGTAIVARRFVAITAAFNGNYICTRFRVPPATATKTYTAQIAHTASTAANVWLGAADVASTMNAVRV